MALEIFKLVGSVFVNNDEANKSISKTDKKAQGLGKTFLDGVGKVGKFGLALGGAAVAGGTALVGLANNAAGSMDRIDKLSNKIGISKQAFQEWDYVLAQNGMDVEKLQVASKNLLGQVDGLANGNKKAIANFKTLGVEVKDTNGKMKSHEQILNETILSLSKMENGAAKNKMAMEIFGKAGQEMIPMLNGGADAIEALTKNAHDLGLVVGDDAVNAGVALGDTMDNVKKAFGGVVTQIGVKLFPIIQTFLDWVLQNMPFFQQIFQSVFGAIETFVTTFFDMFTGILQALGVDFSNLGDSFKDTGDLIGQIFNTLVDNIVFAWDTFGKPLFDSISSMLGFLVEEFNNNFGDIGIIFGDFINDILKFWEENLKPTFKAMGDFLKTYILPVFEAVFKNGIVPVIMAAFKLIGDLWEKTLKPVFKGITDFISGVFTGNFKQAFKGLVNIIDGIWQGIISIIKFPINAIIGMINGFIRGLNKIKIPDWVPFVGGKGINIGEIPLLAKGGKITKSGNAIVGEAGPEMIDLPAGATVRPLNKANGFDTESIIKATNETNSLLKSMIQLLQKGQNILLDGDTLVGRTIERVESTLAARNDYFDYGK